MIVIGFLPPPGEGQEGGSLEKLSTTKAPCQIFTLPTLIKLRFQRKNTRYKLRYKRKKQD